MTEIVWDHRPLYVFHQTSEKKFKILEKRYDDFVAAVNDINREPVNVFDPLKPRLLEELTLIREVSKELQIKKDEDIKKSQAAETEEEQQKEGEDKEVEEQTEAEKTDA